MKKILLSAIIVTCLLATAAYYFYQSHLPDLVAQAVVTDSLPAYIPKRMQNRIRDISKPINESAEAMLEEMHSSDIPVTDVLSVIDDTSEEQAYALLDEINRAQPKTTNEVFDIAKQHIATDFNVEIFRDPFNDHVTMKQIKNAIHFANQNRKTHDIEFSTAKAILKKVLLQKEKEYQSKTGH